MRQKKQNTETTRSPLPRPIQATDGRLRIANHSEGPASFLDLAYETIAAHVQRMGEKQVITGGGAVDPSDVDHEEDAVLRLYVQGEGALDEVHEWVDRALDWDDHDMELDRQGVQGALDEGQKNFRTSQTEL